MNIERFYFQFRWWHIFLILVILVSGILIWVSSWDFEPKVEPTLTIKLDSFSLNPNDLIQFSLKISNNAWIGYDLDPFELDLKNDDQTFMKFKCIEGYQVQARAENQNIPLIMEFNPLGLFPLSWPEKLTAEAKITARKWGFRKTVDVKKDLPLPEGFKRLNPKKEEEDGALPELSQSN